MTLRTIAAAVLAASISSPSFAGETECKPLVVVAQELQAAGATNDNFVAIKSDELPAAYSKAAGFDVPEDSDPIGISFLTGPGVVLVSLIEADYCIKYAIMIPKEKHESALKAIGRAV